LGLGSIHVTLGAVSAVFAIIALFIETEANQVSFLFAKLYRWLVMDKIKK